MDCTNIDYCKNWLKSNLTDERYEHSLGVAECALELAKKYNLDTQKAKFAGLIHDCAKCLPNDELKNSICTLEGLCDGELDNPKAYHAPAGALIAKREFNIEDSEILSAIRWHTLGKPGMSEFEKIIFLADKIETRTRPQEIIAPIRAVLDEENGLNKALLVCYSNTIKSLVDRNLGICLITVETYNELLYKVKNSII